MTKKALSNRSVFIGEIGLTGGMRRMVQAKMRTEEAVKLGFENIFIPESLLEKIHTKVKRLIGLNHIRELRVLLL